MVSGVFVLPGGDSPEPKTAETVPASRLLRPGVGRLLLRSQAQIAAQRGKRCLAPAVPDAGVDRRSSPRPAPAGAILPGVRPSRRPHPSHRRGPHPAPQGRLAAVHGPWQPAIPVPFVPQPQNPGGNAAKITADLPGQNVPESGTLGRGHADSACAAASLQPSPRGPEVSGVGQETVAGPPREIFSLCGRRRT